MRSIRRLEGDMERLHTDIRRFNALIAKNSQLEAILQNENFSLEKEVMAELKGMEEDAAHLESQIDRSRDSKSNALSDTLNVEREILLWERKIQLEREMQQVLDPEVGQDLSAAMKKEIHRMQLRHAELARLQERLIQVGYTQIYVT